MKIKEWNTFDVICLDLSNSTPYKKKKHIINLIVNRGVRVSFVLNKTVKFLIRDDKKNLDTYKCKLAFKLNIPIIELNYLFDSEKGSVNIQNYFLVDKQHEERFKNGYISLKEPPKSWL